MPSLRVENPIKKRYKKKVADTSVPAYTVERSPKQIERKYMRTESAVTALGRINRGIERYILSKGQFSLIEFIDAALRQTGPADMVISTWTAASDDISELYGFFKDGRILSCRFMVDFSFMRRSPMVLGQMRKLFGDDSVRVSQNHAKFVILTNEAYKVTILTSTNLNMNPRMEYFLVREDESLAQFNLDWVNAQFTEQTRADMEHGDWKWHAKRFKNET